MEHIRKVLQACNLLSLALHTLQKKFNHEHNIHNGQTTTDNQPNNNNNGSNNKNISIVVTYIHGLWERFKRTCNNLGIQVHFKGTYTIKTLLMVSRRGTTNFKKVGLYIGLSAHTSTVQRNTQENQAEPAGQFQGTPQAPSPIHHHSHSTGQPVSPKCFSIVDRESQGVTRNIKDNDPSLNRNLTKYQLPHIWYQVLQDTSSLQLK